MDIINSSDQPTKLLVLKTLEGNPPAELTMLQKKMQPYVASMEIFWWMLAVFVFFYHVAPGIRQIWSRDRVLLFFLVLLGMVNWSMLLFFGIF